MEESFPIFTDPVIYAALAVGTTLALFRPFWAILVCIATPLVLGMPTMVFSRLSQAGAYFNLYDTCLYICIFAALLDCSRNRRRVRFPLVAVALIGVLLVGYATALVSYGFFYDSLRGLRWAINVPILYIIAANVLTTERRVQQLLVMMFLATIGGEIQHSLAVLSVAPVAVEDAHQLRTIAFFGSHSEMWLIAGPLFVAGRMRHPALQVSAAILFFVGLVTAQVRSLAIAAACALPIYYGWFVHGSFRDRIRRAIPLILAAAAAFVALQVLGLERAANAYSYRIEGISFNTSADSSTLGRQLAINVEFDDWLRGNILVGRGLSYFVHEHRGGLDEAAFGHIGYVTYLSQLGLLGFFVYALLFPLHTLLGLKRIERSSQWKPETRYFACLGGALFTYFIFLFAMSGNLLGIEILAGLFAGLGTAAKLGQLQPDQSG